MRKILQCIIALIFCANVNAQTGIAVPGLVPCDNLVKNFLSQYNIPGGTMVLAKNGKIVYLRAFGYSDVNKTVPTQPNNLFRIASLSKQVTSVTIMHLLEEGKLTMSSKVFGPSGILKNHPVFSHANITDTRIYNITVQNLLEHAAGWNRDINCNPNPTTPYPYFLGGCDPISYPLRVTMLTGTTNPVSKEALIKYLLEKGLDFAPGTGYNYSNIGFLILGEVIEKLTGLKYEKYVTDSILAPIGIYDMHIAKTLKKDKQEREGEYVGNGYTTLSSYGDGTYVPWEYGGFNVTAMDSHGGWIATPKDLLKLLVSVDGFNTKPDILKPATITIMTTPSANNAYYAKGWSVNPYNNWWHTGALDGTASEQVRASNGYSWAIILNKRDIAANTNFWTDLDNLGWNCIAAATSWPTFDLMLDPTVNASAITFSKVTSTSMHVAFHKGNGARRLVIAGTDSSLTSFPLDGVNYTAKPTLGAGSKFGHNSVVYSGTSNAVTIKGLAPNKRYYIRVVEYNKSTATGNYPLYLLGSNAHNYKKTLASARPGPSTFGVMGTGSKTVKLNWQVSPEKNSTRYLLERSGDGKTFTTVATVTDDDDAAIETYEDLNPLDGTNYYRLQAFDEDANITFQGLRTVDIKGNTFKLSPNPAASMLNIQGNNGKAVQVVDVSGKIIISRTLTPGSNNINVSQLPGGVYIVKIINDKNNVEVHKIVIQR